MNLGRRAFVFALALVSSTLGFAAETTSPQAILMIVTSADEIDKNHPTGLWLEEFAVPWLEFTRAGRPVHVASPGGEGTEVPIDPRSKPTPEQEKEWAEARAALKGTRKLGPGLSADDYAAIFVCGGHGAMIDLARDTYLHDLMGQFAAQGKPVGAVCHGPAPLVGVKGPDGKPLVAGRRVTAFTNEEERAVKLAELMPFLLETRLRELGARFESAPEKFKPHTVRDGNLVTGQNPSSSRGTARALLEVLGESGKPGA